MSIAGNYVRDFDAANDLDRESRLEFYTKMYEVVKIRASRSQVVEVQRPTGTMIRYCMMLTFEDESRLFLYFHERGTPVAFEAYEKVSIR